MLNAVLLTTLIIAFFAGRLTRRMLNRVEEKNSKQLSSDINQIIKTGFTEQESPHRDISIANELILLLRDHK